MCKIFIMDTNINIILFDEEETTQILIENYLKELTFSYKFKKYNEIDFSVLPKEEKNIIVVNVSQGKNSTIEEIKKYSENKNNLFIGISYDKTADLNVNTIRAGAKEFLVKPIIRNEFLYAVQKLKTIFQMAEKELERSNISLVMGVEKEVGKTFFALNIAKEVADASKEKVLLIDFNNDLNDLASKLTMDFVYNTSYIMKEIIKDNYDVLNKINKYPKSSLYIMANGVFCNNIDHSHDNFDIFFSKIRKHFRYIFLDVPRGMELNKSIIKNADSIYAIMTPDIEMFSRACHIIQNHYKGKRTRYILNKFNENREQELVPKLENIINKQIFLRIPQNYMATNAATSNGRTLKEISPKLDVVEKYIKLANFIASRD